MSLRFSKLAQSILVIALLIGTLGISQTTTAKPSWKTDSPESGNTDSTNSGKGTGKNGRDKTSSTDTIVIESQPNSQTVTEGEHVIFSVTASSISTISYQWYFNGNPIAGATLSNLEITSSTLSDQGEYKVQLDNGSTNTQASATLIVEEPVLETAFLSIDIQPSSHNINVSESITLNVSASSNEKPSYQWRKNGVNIPDAIHSYLPIGMATEEDSGIYDVVISTTSNTITSEAATVTVKPLSNIALQWQKPEQREDGSPLLENDITSFNIYLSYENEIEEVITVPGNYTTITLDEMFSGTYQFAIATVDNSGQVGRKSDYLSIDIN